MSGISNVVDLAIEGISAAHGTTKPLLDINLSVKPSNRKITIQQIFSEITFHFPATDKHLDGPNLDVRNSNLSEINTNGTTFNLSAGLSSAELDKIEQFRDGGDITIKLTVQLSTLDRKDNRNSGSITLSKELVDQQWYRILDGFDYHDTRTVEVDVSANNPQIRDKLSTVYAKIDSAQKKHDLGDYPAAVVSCRRAIEALMVIDEIEGVLDDQKHDDLNSVMGNFKGFTGSLSHAKEQTNIEPAMRRDSEFALGITKSCAMYVSTVIDENGQ